MCVGCNTHVQNGGTRENPRRSLVTRSHDIHNDNDAYALERRQSTDSRYSTSYFLLSKHNNLCVVTLTRADNSTLIIVVVVIATVGALKRKKKKLDAPVGRRQSAVTTRQKLSDTQPKQIGKKNNNNNKYFSSRVCLCARVGMCPVSVGFHLVISRGQLIVSDASRQDHDDNKVIHATLFVLAPSPKKMTKEHNNHDGDTTRHDESKNQEKSKGAKLRINWRKIKETTTTTRRGRHPGRLPTETSNT